MTTASAPVRAQRKRRARGLRVAVVGAAGELGSRTAARLLEDPGVRGVVGVDSRRGAVEGVRWRIADLTDPGLARALADVDVVVLAELDLNVCTDPLDRGRRSLRIAQTTVTAAAAVGAARVVVLSSAMVHGARAENPVPLAEDAAERADPDGGLLSDLLELEDLYARAARARPGTAFTVLRPAMLVGPGVDTVLTRHFESPRLLLVRDTRPRWQFCHVDDLASAVVVAVTAGLDGAVAVGYPGWLEQHEVEAASGRSHLELPAALAYGTAQRLHRLGVTRAAASELDYLSQPWVVHPARLLAAGWVPQHDNATAVQALLTEVEGRLALGGRRVGRRETAATLGAAGATVAVLGTAVAVRRARRRRR